MYRIDREIYNILDLIGDVGGLQQGISIIIIFILSVLNFLDFENYMVSQLFTKEPDKKKPPLKTINEADDEDKSDTL